MKFYYTSSKTYSAGQGSVESRLVDWGHKLANRVGVKLRFRVRNSKDKGAVAMYHPKYGKFNIDESTVKTHVRSLLDPKPHSCVIQYRSGDVSTLARLLGHFSNCCEGGKFTSGVEKSRFFFTDERFERRGKYNDSIIPLVAGYFKKSYMTVIAPYIIILGSDLVGTKMAINSGRRILQSIEAPDEVLEAYDKDNRKLAISTLGRVAKEFGYVNGSYYLGRSISSDDVSALDEITDASGALKELDKL